MEGIYGIYALLAFLIPLIIEAIKKYTNWIPSRILPILPPILGFVGVFLAQLSTGATLIAAITAALSVDGVAVGGTASMLRQIVSKSIKNQ